MQQDPGKENKHEVPLRGSSIVLQTSVITPSEDSNKIRESILSSQQNRQSYPVKPEIVSEPEKNSDFRMTCLKVLLILSNTIIWLLGAGIAGISIWMKSDPDFWTLQLNLDMKQFSTAAIIGIVVGFVILTIGLMGCYGAMKKNICLLLTFIIVMVILLLLEAVATGLVWASVNNSELKDELARITKKSLEGRTEDPSAAYFINLIQAELHCCGLQGTTDYADTNIPPSCTNLDTGLPYEKGCIDSLFEYFKSKAFLFGGITIAVLLLQLLVITMAGCILCGIRQAKNEIF